MIPDPDEHDSDREWAVAATERYVGAFAAEHDLDEPDVITTPEITETLTEVNLALLDRVRATPEDGSPPPTATGRMPDSNGHDPNDPNDPNDQSDPSDPSDHDRAASPGDADDPAGPVPFGSRPDGVAEDAWTAGPSREESATAPPSGVVPTDDAPASGTHRDDPGGVALLSQIALFTYFVAIVLMLVSPLVYYSQTSFAFTDLPALQGTIFAAVPATPLLAAGALSGAVFLVSALLLLVGRYGVVNPPDAGTVRERRPWLRVFAHATALSLLATVAIGAAFAILIGRPSTAFLSP